MNRNSNYPIEENILDLDNYYVGSVSTTDTNQMSVLEPVIQECEVKWFRGPEAYGFLRIVGDSKINWITPESDIFIHASKLNMVTELKAGDRLKCKITKGMRGPQVEEIYEHNTPEMTNNNHEEQEDYIMGYVKWFDEVRGFGFIVPLNNSQGRQCDMFISAARLAQLGIPISLLKPNTKVWFTYKLDKEKVLIDKLMLESEPAVKA